MFKWFIIITFLIIWDANCSGQQIVNLQQKVDISYQNKKLGSILKRLRKEYDVKFSYSNSLLPLKKKMSLQVNQVTLDEALHQLFDPIAIQYTLIGDQVALKKKRLSQAAETVLIDSTARDSLLPVSVNLVLTDAITGAPVPDVHLYQKKELIGISNQQGAYSLTLNDSSKIRISLSHIGYEVLTQSVDPKVKNRYVFTLIPKIEELKKITISINRDRRWKRLFKRFKRRFMGTSTNAQKCRILNPWIVTFEETPKGIKLKNNLPDTLRIKNPALGYSLEFLLKKFKEEDERVYYTGDCWFNELKPKNKAEYKRWTKNRRRAYQGSIAHFLAALVNDRVQQEGFELSATPFVPPTSPSNYIHVSANQILSKGQRPNEYVLHSDYYLKVVYNRELEEYNYLRLQKSYNPQVKPKLNPKSQKSWLWLNQASIVFDTRCEVIYNADKVHRLGYWSWEGVGEMLPSSYLHKAFEKMAEKTKEKD